MEPTMGHFLRTIPHDGLVIVHIAKAELMEDQPSVRHQQAQAKQEGDPCQLFLPAREA
jgi:hypothetical protein